MKINTNTASAIRQSLMGVFNLVDTCLATTAKWLGGTSAKQYTTCFTDFNIKYIKM